MLDGNLADPSLILMLVCKCHANRSIFFDSMDLFAWHFSGRSQKHLMRGAWLNCYFWGSARIPLIHPRFSSSLSVVYTFRSGLGAVVGPSEMRMDTQTFSATANVIRKEWEEGKKSAKFASSHDRKNSCCWPGCALVGAFRECLSVSHTHQHQTEAAVVCWWW